MGEVESDYVWMIVYKGNNCEGADMVTEGEINMFERAFCSVEQA
jgi:hypothetical protein